MSEDYEGPEDDELFSARHESIDHLIEHLQSIREQYGDVPVVVPADTDGYSASSRVVLTEVVDKGEVYPWQGRYERSCYVHDDGAHERLRAVILE